eukprot:TRINITY_DN49499_c0_g2_i1.p1 TRINITY_DN49499_c0_g2~~TRINITY_DN49499_c0_g2_i1.p1  ORF type:complete len:170 (-),score=41.60 TRINITY_DN49499_c0_g2_i1:161-625(-)
MQPTAFTQPAAPNSTGGGINHTTTQPAAFNPLTPTQAKTHFAPTVESRQLPPQQQQPAQNSFFEPPPPAFHVQQMHDYTTDTGGGTSSGTSGTTSSSSSGSSSSSSDEDTSGSTSAGAHYRPPPKVRPKVAIGKRHGPPAPIPDQDGCWAPPPE